MKRFSIFHVPVLSFFSSALYRDVGRYWKGVCFGYLLLLLLVCWIPLMVKMHTGFAGFLEKDAPTVLDQIPEIQIANGEASTPENRPYPIVDPESGTLVFLIDTTGATTSLEQAGPTVKGLVTKTQAIVEKNEFQTQTYDFNELPDFTLTREKIEGWLVLTKKLLVPVVMPFAVLGSYVYRILQALFYSLFGLLIAAISGASGRLSYGALLRLTVVAMTPAILLKTGLGIFGASFSGSWILFFVISMAYLFFGIRSANKPEETSGAPPLPGSAI